MRVIFLVSVLSICGCKVLDPFMSDVGRASQGLEVGGPGADTAGEQVVEAIELARPALPPVVGWIFSALLSGAAVYTHLKKGELDEVSS